MLALDREDCAALLALDRLFDAETEATLDADEAELDSEV